MFICLTAVPNPDIDDGKPHSIYIEATSILTIQRTSIRSIKNSSMEKKHKLIFDLWEASSKLSHHVGSYIPDMTDPVAVEWMGQTRETAALVSEAYSVLSKVSSNPEYHPEQVCTEIQLSCGTALEHGVMLGRIYVSELPEDVYHIIMFPFHQRKDIT